MVKIFNLPVHAMFPGAHLKTRQGWDHQIPVHAMFPGAHQETPQGWDFREHKNRKSKTTNTQRTKITTV